jgi:hypothetical protein
MSLSINMVYLITKQRVIKEVDLMVFSNSIKEDFSIPLINNPHYPPLRKGESRITSCIEKSPLL